MPNTYLCYDFLVSRYNKDISCNKRMMKTRPKVIKQVKKLAMVYLLYQFTFLPFWIEAMIQII